MAGAKDIEVRVIPAKVANPFVKRIHYSGKVVNNSQLHFGVFYHGKLHGVMSFGPSMDKSKIIGLVKGTKWNEFVELNRMAFDSVLPRNSESRAISIAMKLIRKNAPHVKWIVSFADGCQCGDGTIYRASGFVLTGISKNTTIYEFPNGQVISNLTLNAHSNSRSVLDLCKDLGVQVKPRSISEWKKLWGTCKDGYMLRYIYFIDKSCRDKLTVPEIPFSKIGELGIGMYKGEHVER